MKKYLKRTLALVMCGILLIPAGMKEKAYADDTDGFGNVVISSSFNDNLNKKTENLAKKLAEKGIKKAVGKIPVVGDTINSIAGPYIKKLLGIKEEESTNEKLDRIESKLDSLKQTIETNTQTTLKKHYESYFNSFNIKLTAVRDKTSEYLQHISKIDRNNTSEEEKTLLIANLTRMDGFEKYIADVSEVSQIVSGDNIELHPDGTLYSKVYKIFCEDARAVDGCALGGEAAILASDYVNSVNEVVDAAHKTAAILLLARCCVGDNYSIYDNLQDNGKITKEISLSGFGKYDADIYRTKYDLLKTKYYNIFGITDEDVAEANALEKVLTVKDGAVDQYNQMIEDRWFDYINKVDFTKEVPEVNFTEMDGEIGAGKLEDFGYSAATLGKTGQSGAYDLCNLVSKRINSGKQTAINEEQFNNLIKHIQNSPHFKYEKPFEGADYAEISLKDALILYGFSFDALDSVMSPSGDSKAVFATDAKVDVENYYSEYTSDSYVDAYVYGYDYNEITEKLSSSAVKKYQYFEGAYHSNYADKKNTGFQEINVLYFKNTKILNTTTAFKDFIEEVAGGNNYAYKSVKLNCDVDLSMTDYSKLWPNAARNCEFRGTFDGEGHTISGFHVAADESRLGLFRTTGDGAVIRNLIMKDVSVKNTGTGSGCASLVGYANGDLSVEFVRIDNGSVSGYKYAAGILGESKEGKEVTASLNNCQNFADISSENCDAAGLAANIAEAVVVNCVNGGSITAKNGSAGGIVAYVGNKDTDPNVYIEGCFNIGRITGYDCAGGIVGHIESDGSKTIITGNTNEGDVTLTAKRSAGGIAGRICTGGEVSYNINRGNIENQSTGDNAEAGGIIGENEDDAIVVSDNENTGNVTGNRRAGGIAGTLGDRDHDKECTVRNNRNSGNITSKMKDAAGIIGAVATDNRSHIIELNINTGRIEANSEAGGIVGWMAGGGSFVSNSNTGIIISREYNAGGIVGCIQDDECTFKGSSIGMPYVGTGTVTAGNISGSDYYINAVNTEKHAGGICGWDGRKKKSVSNDDLLGSIFGDGNVVLIIVIGVILAAAVVVFVVWGKKKSKSGEAEESRSEEGNRAE